MSNYPPHSFFGKSISILLLFLFIYLNSTGRTLKMNTKANTSQQASVVVILLLEKKHYTRAIFYFLN